MVRKFIVTTVIVFMVLSAVTCYAADEGKKGPYNKVERGIKNMTTGWMEIPRTMTRMTKDRGPIIGFTVGLFEGVFNAFAKTTSGVFDAATAPVGTYNKPQIKDTMIEGTSSLKVGK